MSEIEDLDSLDNQSLHAKCMEYGMPNIPVTSSSRGVLLKRLKAVMSDPTAAAAAVAKKANRRETIHSTRPMTPSKQSGAAGGAAAGERKDERGTPARTSRRTIAAVAAPSDVEDKMEVAEQPAPITGRRRSTAQKTITEFVSSEKESNEMAASTAGKERRRSVRGESQTKVSPTSNVVASERPQTISEDDEYLSPSQQQPQRPSQRRAGSAMLEMAQQYTAAAAKTKQTSPYLRDGSIVILESEEDDDDDDLLRAVEQAEQQTKTKVTPSRMSRGGSQTQGSTAYRQQQAASISLTQPQREPQQKPVDYGFVRPLSGSMSSNIRSSIPASQPVVSSGGRQALDYSSTRYSSSVLPPLVSKSYSSALPSLQQQQRYSTSSITTSSITKSSAYKPSSYVLNEQSDDAAGEASGDDLNTPFLSSFARNLERIKTEGIASPRYRGSRMSDNYQSYGSSQSMRAAGVSYWQRMDRKYHLRLVIILMILIMILAFFYVLFFN